MIVKPVIGKFVIAKFVIATFVIAKFAKFVVAKFVITSGQKETSQCFQLDNSTIQQKIREKIQKALHIRFTDQKVTLYRKKKHLLYFYFTLKFSGPGGKGNMVKKRL